MEQQLSFEDSDLKIFYENGIVICQYKAENITMDIAKKSLKWRLEIYQGKYRPIISDIRMMKQMDQSVKDFLSSEEGCELVNAGAIIVTSVFQKIAGNFFILINKPPLPARVFTDQQEAIKWLERFKSA